MVAVERWRDHASKVLSRPLHRAPYRVKLTGAWHGLGRLASYLRVHDEMTGLLNRRQFNLRATRELAQRAGQCALLLFDLDRLAHANSALGHKPVDACIVATARMVERLADGNLVARYSGGNFAVLVSDKSRAPELVELVRSAVASAFCEERAQTLKARKDLTGTPVLTVSVGAVNAKASDTIAYLVQRADMAMFEAKSAGRDCVRWADGTT